MEVPYEISASGLAQHPLHFPEAPAIVPTTASLVADAAPRRRYCHCRCCGEVAIVISCALVVALVPAVFLPQPIGLVVSAMLPTAVFMGYTYYTFWPSLLKKQMAITFLEAILWMVPFSVFVMVLIITGYHNLCRCHQACPPEDENGTATGECVQVCDQSVGCYLHDTFRAFIQVALVEEILKFLCIRRITFASLVVDAQSLFVYGGCGALGFATIENILYVSSGGMQLAVVRALSAIPMHMSTGVLMGCSLGYGRFLGRQVHCCSVLIVPVLVHGFYDFFLFVGARIGGGWPLIGFLLTACVCILGWLRVRTLILDLEVVPALDVRSLIKQGIVQEPSVLCCMCRWHARDAQPVEAGGEQRFSDDGKPYTFKDFVDFYGRDEAVQRWAQATPVPAAEVVGKRTE